MPESTLSPEALAQVPEVRKARTAFGLAVVRAASGGLKFAKHHPDQEFDALLLAIRNAVLSAERQRLLGMTAYEVKVQAAQAMMKVVDDCGMETSRAVFETALQAALPLLLAPEVAKREAAEADRDVWYKGYMLVADAVARDSTGPDDLAQKARATRLLNDDLSAEVSRLLRSGQDLRERVTAAEAEVTRLREVLEGLMGDVKYAIGELDAGQDIDAHSTLREAQRKHGPALSGRDTV